MSNNQQIMNPKDAWLYAATWGSYRTSGDPGAVMYGFDEHCRIHSEGHRAAVLAWVADCRRTVEANPSDYDADELVKLDSFVRYIRQAPMSS